MECRLADLPCVKADKDRETETENTYCRNVLMMMMMMIWLRKWYYSVKVIVVGNGHSDTSSNPDEADYITHCTNTLRKGRNAIILPPAMGK